ncbi:hypothetical protein KY290_021045 [Solanum tuberosum]|uniref:Uncharacterized protein n=1 Tax=Solanum tuberosum TaxID=4113 RepID=A0ABQ7V2F7_SOLTU|nr:hypothetical protein KY289_020228 [Solanum tuberosum]KAH0757552.1 hypothetical protein KY290_021045 [Solanum tuberosum]
MREWAKLLLSVYPALETNLDKQPVTSQAIFQTNPPPVHPTSQPQNQPSSIQLPPKNTHIPNYPYHLQHHAYSSRPPYFTPHLQNPIIQAAQYQTPLHQVPWLKVGGYVTPIPAKNPDAQSKWYDPNKICEYHSGMKWHTTEECCALRNKIHQLIEAKVIHWIDLVPKGFQP